MYFNEITKDNMTYSVDMIRLKTSMTYLDYTKMEYMFKTAWSKYVKKVFISNSIKGFKYNHVIEIEEGKSFWFGFMHNMEKPSHSEKAQYNFTIEFNPNKLKNHKVILYLLSHSIYWVIKSLDLAIDLPINILNIIYDKKYKRNVRKEEKGYDDKTIYIGEKESNVSYKLYNKKIQAKLNIWGDLTRVEITRRYEDYSILIIKHFNYNESDFPVLYLNEYIFDFDFYRGTTLSACVYAVLNGLDFNILTDYYKKKVTENLIKAGNKVEFDSEVATEVIRNCIYNYFPYTKD